MSTYIIIPELYAIAGQKTGQYRDFRTLDELVQWFAKAQAKAKAVASTTKFQAFTSMVTSSDRQLLISLARQHGVYINFLPTHQFARKVAEYTAKNETLWHAMLDYRRLCDEDHEL